MNKLWQRILVTVLGGIIFFLVVQKFSRETTPKLINKKRCEFEEDVIRQGFKGIVTRTYRDKEYDEVMEYISLVDGDTAKSSIFILEASGVIAQLVPGDTVRKEVGSLDLIVSRNGKEVFELIYNCDSY